MRRPVPISVVILHTVTFQSSSRRLLWNCNSAETFHSQDWFQLWLKQNAFLLLILLIYHFLRLLSSAPRTSSLCSLSKLSLFSLYKYFFCWLSMFRSKPPWNGVPNKFSFLEICIINICMTIRMTAQLLLNRPRNRLPWNVRYMFAVFRKITDVWRDNSWVGFHCTVAVLRL